MYRNLILLSFVFCAPLLLLGQSKLSKDFKVTTGEPYKVIDAGNKQYFALENNKTIAIKTRGEEVTLQRFDTKSMKEISRNEYDDFPKYTKVQKILQIRGKLFYIYEAYNKKDKNKSFTLYIREINVDKGTFKEAQELFTTSGSVLHSPSVGML